MNESKNSTDTPFIPAKPTTDVASTMSIQAHLLTNAHQCVQEREKYIAKLGDAQGNDVFKYLLLLNWIDCQGYVAEIQLQAHNSFRWSTGVAIAGFCLITMSVMTAVASQMLDGKSLEIVYISGLSGLITTFISSIFFYLYNRSLNRLETFHTQLREIQKVVVSLFLSGLIEQPEQGDHEKQAIIRRLLADLDRTHDHSAHTSNKHNTPSSTNGVAQPVS